MGIVSVEKISAERFLAWVAGQDGRFELVDGEVTAMAGAGRRHDHIVVNAITAINRQVRGGPCQTFTGDTYISISPQTRRMPDLGVDCGTPAEDSLTADKPTLVVEVLSPTTKGFDVTTKLDEYRTVPSLDYILILDTESPDALLHIRLPDRHWGSVRLSGLSAALEMPTLGIHLTLAEFYDGLTFRPQPQLVDFGPAGED